MTEHEPEASPAETPETTTKTPAPATRQGDSTTMRFQGVGTGHESVEIDGSGLSAEDQATIDALRPGTGLLIVLDDVTVSRKHAVFVQENDGYAVRDVGSLNGTYVNRELVDHAALRTGDEVQIGKFRLVFYAGQRQ